jgi:hypothetical protein
LFGVTATTDGVTLGVTWCCDDDVCVTADSIDVRWSESLPSLNVDDELLLQLSTSSSSSSSSKSMSSSS